MLVKEIMSKKPEFLPPTAVLKQVADQMKTHDYGFIPIGENDRLIGAVTDRDITIRAIASGKDPNKTLARDVMTKEIHYCFENDSLEKIVQQLKKLHVRRLVVLNQEKRMTGIISFNDIVAKCKDPALLLELSEVVTHH